MSSLFAKGHKNNPRTKEEQVAHDKAQAQAEIDENWQQYKEAEAKFIAERTELMNSMTPEEWQEFLKAEAKENAKEYAGASGAWIR